MKTRYQTFLFLLTCYTLTSYATPPTYCSDENIAHCAYFSGLAPYDPKDGRYIKVYDPNLNIARISCSADNYIELMLDSNRDLEYYYHYGLTNRIRHFYICSDATGVFCEPVGTDSFMVLKNENRYASEPKFYEVSLATVKHKYPACSKWQS